MSNSDPNDPNDPNPLDASLAALSQFALGIMGLMAVYVIFVKGCIEGKPMPRLRNPWELPNDSSRFDPPCDTNYPLGSDQDQGFLSLVGKDIMQCTQLQGGLSPESAFLQAESNNASSPSVFEWDEINNA